MTTPKLRLSISQIEAHSNCNRQWRFLKVEKLPQVAEESRALIFGDILHAVVERFISADDRGYDPKGNPVNLYPANWHYNVNRFSGKLEKTFVTPDEQVSIQKLVQAAIDEGVLQRKPNRAIEFPLKHELEVNGVSLSISGFIDYIYPGVIEDHKTTSKMKNAKSSNALRKNNQLMYYAWCVFNLPELVKFKPQSDVITIRHNYFCTDPKELRVKVVTAEVTRDEVEDFYFTNIKKELEHITLSYLEKDLNLVPKCNDIYKGCYAYGRTCPFLPICNGEKTIQEYKIHSEKVKKSLEENKLKSINQDQQGNTMSSSLLNRLKGNNAGQGNQGQFNQAPMAMPQSPIPQQAPVQHAPVQQAPQVNTNWPTLYPNGAVQQAPQVNTNWAAPVHQAPQVNTNWAAPAPIQQAPVSTAVNVGCIPPWYVEGTLVTQGGYPGFAPNGMPCSICSMKQRKAGEGKKILPEDFLITSNPDGSIYWELKEDKFYVSPYTNLENKYGTTSPFLKANEVKVSEPEYSELETPVIEESEIGMPPAPIQNFVAPVQNQTQEPPKVTRKRATKAEMEAKSNPKAEVLTPTNSPVSPVLHNSTDINKAVEPTERDITLMLGIRMVKGNMPITNLMDMAISIIKEIETDNNGIEYYTLNSFDRKDVFTAKARYRINSLKEGIFASNVNPLPEENILIKFLTPLANTIIVASV